VLEGGMSSSRGGERIGSVLSPPMSGLGVGHWLTRTGSKSSKATPVSDRQPPHLNTTLGRATLPGRATRS
jgi:hypothetical protein